MIILGSGFEYGFRYTSGADERATLEHFERFKHGEERSEGFGRFELPPTCWINSTINAELTLGIAIGIALAELGISGAGPWVDLWRELHAVDLDPDLHAFDARYSAWSDRAAANPDTDEDEPEAPDGGHPEFWAALAACRNEIDLAIVVWQFDLATMQRLVLARLLVCEVGRWVREIPKARLDARSRAEGNAHVRKVYSPIIEALSKFPSLSGQIAREAINEVQQMDLDWRINVAYSKAMGKLAKGPAGEIRDLARSAISAAHGPAEDPADFDNIDGE